jgi:hypothetical protein
MEDSPSRKRKRNPGLTIEQIRGYVRNIDQLRHSYGTMLDKKNYWIVNAYRSECNRALQELFPDKYPQIEAFKNDLCISSFVIDLDKFPRIGRIILGNKDELGKKSKVELWEAIESASFIHTQLHILYILNNAQARERIKQLTWIDEFLERHPLLEIEKK